MLFFSIYKNFDKEKNEKDEEYEKSKNKIATIGLACVRKVIEIYLFIKTFFRF